MATVSDLYDYPVLISSEDFERNTGRNLSIEIEGDNGFRVENFLNTIHEQIFDMVIYQTGSKVIKDRIIKAYSEELVKPIKRALIIQGKWLLENDGIHLWNGVVSTINGADVKDIQDVIQRIVCPQAINILLGTQPNILYAGEK